MKKIIFLVVYSFIFISSYADEGFWIPLFLNKYNIEDMQQKGFKLSAEDLYDVNKSSLKDAIMLFGGGCTAEVISEKGLILTNHHCGFSSIQSHSTIKHDYLTDGFWAMSQSEELPNPGLSVSFLVYMQDVSERVNNVVNEQMPESLRQYKVDSVCTKIENEIIAKHKGQYEAEVEDFFYGNQFIVMVTEVFEDIRLVGAPPSAIGKFGGDTDNWMWPRHTGDFSMFRIYANKENKPATYSPDNVPYKPKKSLTISIKGVKKDDFTLIFGYPGHTQEYIPSYSISNIINYTNPDKISLREIKLNIINKAMDSDRQTRIQYASKQSSIANGWKKWIGQNIGLKRIDILSEKKRDETKFQEWANKPENRLYKNILSEYEKLEEQINTYNKPYNYFIECIYFTDLRKIFNSVGDKIKSYNEADKKTKDSLRANYSDYVDDLFKNYNSAIDQAIMTELMKNYFEKIDSEFYPEIYHTIKSDFNNNIEKYVEHIYNNSIYTNRDRLREFLNLYYNDKSYKRRYNKEAKYTVEDLTADAFYIFYKSFNELYWHNIAPDLSKLSAKKDSLNHLYMQAQMKQHPNKVFYPDANLTLRVAYGKVEGFAPKDGVLYNYFTTLDGIIEKDNPEIYDYKVPERLKELYKTKDYGKYADADGKLHVCFLGSNHTTGGNSGSPVLNANGELVGVNFDRCWEGTMSDIKFDPNYCRNIMLDIRYVLFIIDKYAGANYLIKEMKINN